MDDEGGPAQGERAPTATIDPAAPRWSRRLARALGWTAAVLAVPFGIAFTLVAQWLANCELGFFGETGPTESAAGYRLDDGILFLVGLALAVGPMLLIAWRNPHPERRRAARTTALVVVALLIVLQAPHAADSSSFWENSCT